MFWIKWRADHHPVGFESDMVALYRSQIFDKGPDYKNDYQARRQGVEEGGNAIPLTAWPEDLGDAYKVSAIVALCVQGVVLRMVAVLILCLRDRRKQV